MSVRQQWPEPVVAAVQSAGIDPDELADLIRMALDEDLDGGVDVTTVATVPADQRATLDLVARSAGVSAGAPIAAAVFAEVCRRAAALPTPPPIGVLTSAIGGPRRRLR